MLHSSIEAASIPSFVCVKIGAVFRKDFKKTMFYQGLFGVCLPNIK